MQGGKEEDVSNVLIVDGDPTARTVLHAAISHAGFAVSAVATLEGARSILARDRIGVVLLELELPDGHGFDLLRELRDGPAAIVVSTMHQHQHIARSRTFGAVDYVTKPFSPRELIERIRPFLRRVAA